MIIFFIGDDNFKDVFGQLKNAQIELISTKQKLSYLENMNNVFSTQFDSLQEKLNEFNKILIASEERASVLESNNINLQQQQVILM